MSLEEEIINLISINFSIKKENIKKSHRLSELGLTELDILELQMDVEDRYNLSIPDEESKHLSTVGLLMNYIAKNQNTINYSS